MTELQNTTTNDKVGCFLIKLGQTVSQLDEQFANEQGDIKIEDLQEGIKALGFVYTEFKSAYEDCLGKEFSILENVSGPLGSIVELLLNLIVKQSQDGKV